MSSSFIFPCASHLRSAFSLCGCEVQKWLTGEVTRLDLGRREVMAEYSGRQKTVNIDAPELQSYFRAVSHSVSQNVSPNGVPLGFAMATSGGSPCDTHVLSELWPGLWANRWIGANPFSLAWAGPNLLRLRLSK